MATMTKAERLEELDCIRMVAEEAMNLQPRCPVGFNHGYLWCYATVDGKQYKMLIGGGCPASWTDVELAVKKACKEITLTWVNMD